jgi:glycosyltransferase involved in cell wall biosynthesis
MRGSHTALASIIPDARPRTELAQLGIITSCPELIKEGTGIAMSLGNLSRALEARGVEVDFLLPRLAHAATDEADVAELVRCNFRVSGKLPSVVLCVDGDGFAVPGRKAGGRVRKVVHVRTNFIELLEMAPESARGHLERQAHLLAENLRTADAFVTTSEYTRRQLERAGIPLPSRHQVLPNALDVELERELARSSVSREPTPLIVGYGMATWRKDFATAIEASLELRRRGVEHQLELLVSGPALPELEQRVRESGASHIRLLPTTSSRKQLAQLLRRAWVVCHPALQEDFGNNFLEAAATGVPLAASRTAIAEEHAIEDGAGLLAPCGDSHAFSVIIEQLIARGTKTAMGTPLPTRYSGWTWEQAAERLQDFCTELLHA